MPMSFQERFAREIAVLLDETFESVHGIFLDKNTSLRETLAQITAERASRAVSARGTSIAAHVAHLTFYLDLLERGLHGEVLEKVDWEETWRTTQVTTKAWTQMQADVEETYRRVVATLDTPATWDGEDAVGDALAILAHTAYHLGAIRQMLLVID